MLGAITFGMIQVGLVLAGAPGHFFKTLTGLIVVGAVILNTDVARRMARSKPLARLPARAARPADAAILASARRPAVAAGGEHGRRERPERLRHARAASGPAGCRRQRLRSALGARKVEPIPPGAVPVMEAVNISKAFGATTALVDVSLKAYAGRILALLGDNGAGKSTLIKILSGVFPPDRGELRFRGEPVTFTNPAEARSRGIATVFQDLAVCELLSVTRNVVLGREPLKGVGPFKWLDIKRADEMARSALLRLGVRWERGLEERGINISGGERQSLAIARAMFFGSSLLILDEPTSALAVRQAGRVLDHIAQARDQGQAIILITHNFRHALSVADDLTVLAQGRVAGHFPPRRDRARRPHGSRRPRRLSACRRAFGGAAAATTPAQAPRRPSAAARRRRGHAPGIDPGIAEEDAVLGRRVAVVRGEGREIDAVPQAPRRAPRRRRRGLPEAADHLHARVGLLDRQPVVEPRPATCDEIALAAGIEAAHAAEVGGKEALSDEVGERRLQEERRILAGDADRRLEALDELRRHDDVGDAERREHRLRHRADIDDAAAVIEALHGGDRMAAEAVLAVVVVLDDPGVVLLGELEQAEADVHRHDEAERPLAGRGDEDQAAAAAGCRYRSASRPA